MYWSLFVSFHSLRSLVHLPKNVWYQPICQQWATCHIFNKKLRFWRITTCWFSFVCFHSFHSLLRLPMIDNVTLITTNYKLSLRITDSSAKSDIQSDVILTVQHCAGIEKIQFLNQNRASITLFCPVHLFCLNCRKDLLFESVEFPNKSLHLRLSICCQKA